MMRFVGKFLIERRILANHRQLSRFSPLIDITPEILNALDRNGPVVALESTIISHGMPYPDNLKTAKDVEAIVREQNAIPATIAVMNGRIKVGLSDDELLMLANQEHGKRAEDAETITSKYRSPNKEKDNVAEAKIVKTSRRDMAYVLSHPNWIGGTTVAGTLIAANLVGINVMATGGIGGVHRDGHNTLDISADLTELGRSAVAVVASGVKSILDIPRTLEYLETQGVTVSAYQTEYFPAFYTRSSGVKSPYTFANPGEVAQAINVFNILNLRSGMLIGVPIPLHHALDETTMNDVINDALRKCKESGINGKEITPFLLSAITKITKGKSLEANIALVKNNAKIAAEIAVELSKLKRGSRTAQGSCNEPMETNTTSSTPVIIGGSIIDTSFTVLDEDIQAESKLFWKGKKKAE